jgi:hypothetical protein
MICLQMERDVAIYMYYKADLCRRMYADELREYDSSFFDWWEPPEEITRKLELDSGGQDDVEAMIEDICERLDIDPKFHFRRDYLEKKRRKT